MDQGDKGDPEKLRREREELEQQRKKGLNLNLVLLCFQRVSMYVSKMDKFGYLHVFIF